MMLTEDLSTEVKCGGTNKMVTRAYWSPGSASTADVATSTDGLRLLRLRRDARPSTKSTELAMFGLWCFGDHVILYSNTITAIHCNILHASMSLIDSAVAGDPSARSQGATHATHATHDPRLHPAVASPSHGQDFVAEGYVVKRATSPVKASWRCTKYSHWIWSDIIQHYSTVLYILRCFSRKLDDSVARKKSRRE